MISQICGLFVTAAIGEEAPKTKIKLLVQAETAVCPGLTQVLGISQGRITMNYKLLLAVPLMTLALNTQAGKGGVGAIFGALIGGAVG